MTRFILSAGYDKSLAAIAVAELAMRRGHEIAGVAVVSPFRIARVQAIVKSRNRRLLLKTVLKLFGLTGIQYKKNIMHSPLPRWLHENHVMERTLRRWCQQNRITYKKVTDLNSPNVIEWVTKTDVAGLVYCGGGILKKSLIEVMNGKILNAHAGPLPWVRGMNAIEWAVLLAAPLAVTIHFIDAGIDTGRVVKRIPIPLNSPPASINELRELAVIQGIKGLVDNIGALEQPLPEPLNDAAMYRQCFMLCDGLRAHLDDRLIAGCRGGSGRFREVN